MLTREEQAAVDALPSVPCEDEWCDGACSWCIEAPVYLGDALEAIDRVRKARTTERALRLLELTKMD